MMHDIREFIQALIRGITSLRLPKRKPKAIPKPTNKKLDPRPDEYLEHDKPKAVKIKGKNHRRKK